jgi:hypothetical protein
MICVDLVGLVQFSTRKCLIEIRTAGPPHALTLTPDRRVLSADGTSLAFLVVEVVDRAGVLGPSAGRRPHGPAPPDHAGPGARAAAE